MKKLLSITFFAATVLILYSCANVGNGRTVSTDTVASESANKDVMQEALASSDYVETAADAVPDEVTITGTLKMMVSLWGEGARVQKYTTKKGEVKYRLVPDADADPWVSEYYDLEGEGEYLAYVVRLDKPMDVTPYISSDEDELIDAPVSDIMIVRNHAVPGKDFAEAYANKHVCITGTLDVPGGGWRNVTEVVMNIDEIKAIK